MKTEVSSLRLLTLHVSQWEAGSAERRQRRVLLLPAAGIVLTSFLMIPIPVRAETSSPDGGSAASTAMAAPLAPVLPAPAPLKASVKKKGKKPAPAPAKHPAPKKPATTSPAPVDAGTAAASTSAAAPPEPDGSRIIYATGKKPSPSAVRLQEKMNGGDAPPANPLADVVRATEEAKKKRTGKVTKVITSETVEANKEKNSKGKNGGAGRPPTPASTPTALGYDGVRDSKGRDEIWWRAAMDGAKAQINSQESRIESLQSEIDQLRNAFYAQDDPAYRDGVIKPKWDDRLNQLESAKSDLEKAKAGYASLQEDARKSGALPGWLR